MVENDVMLTAKQVRNRYGGVSDMAIWRWLRDENLGFPQPVLINGRRYWWLSQLSAWERARHRKTEVAA
jgi:predicted DNA-binding transcriptional regulator AlpA